MASLNALHFRTTHAKQMVWIFGQLFHICRMGRGTAVRKSSTTYPILLLYRLGLVKS